MPDVSALGCICTAAVPQLVESIVANIQCVSVLWSTIFSLLPHLVLNSLENVHKCLNLFMIYITSIVINIPIIAALNKLC